MKMRREIRIQLQVVFMLLLTGGAFLASVWKQHGPAVALFESGEFLFRWLLSFLVLCAIRLIYIRLVDPARLAAPKGQIFNEIIVTAAYAVLGTFSVFLSYLVYLFQLPPGVNIWEVWLNFRPMLSALLIGFNFLLLVRLAFIILSRTEKLS